ncbi:MAG: magnesium/cobalt transporter CorA [Actinomycetota bacterium]
MITGLLYRDGHTSEEAFDLETTAARRHEAGAFAWLDIIDPDRADLERLQAAFDLHPVTLEDTMHRRQRSKVELFEGYAFVVLRPVTVEPGSPVILAEHEIHAIAGEGFLVTLRWSPGYPMRGVEARWERHADLHTVGFALYVLLDEVVDGYLSAIEALEDEADVLEDMVFERDGDAARPSNVQERLFHLKRDTVVLRRSAMPLRQGIDMIQEEPTLATSPLAPYYRDVMDHVIRVVEMADNVRDLLTSLLEVRVAQAANRLNEVMKKLSAWAAIVLVPTLIAGVYGMNFTHMPELRWLFGYPMAIVLMVASALALYVTFKRRDWL